MLEWLKGILGESYTEDIDKAISAEIGKGFVAKADFDTKNAELKKLRGQLEAANKTIGEYKAMDIEALRKDAADWKQKAEQAEKDAAAQVEAVRFDARLDAAIGKAHGRNTKAIKALLDMDTLRQSKEPDKDITAALDALAKDSGYLFEPAAGANYAGGTGTNPPAGDPDAALRAAFGLPVKNDTK